jgi:hypothetical protein
MSKKKKFDRRRKTELGAETIAALQQGRVMAVERRDALIGELTIAIGLWLDGRDALTIHLIAMAAHQCLCDLGYPSILKKEVGWEHFGMAYDWLHHAKADPHDALVFSPRTNEVILWECCMGMKQVFGGSTTQMDAFALWAALQNPNRLIWFPFTITKAHQHAYTLYDMYQLHVDTPNESLAVNAGP